MSEPIKGQQPVYVKLHERIQSLPEITAARKALFLSRIPIEWPWECWNWMGPKDRCGYGLFRLETYGRQFKAHRIAYTIHKGEIPKGLMVCHSCDNPYCCNPDHLFVGTHQDNVNDKVSKGRCPHGPAHFKARLDEEKVRMIRSSPLGVKKLSKLIGVSTSAIQQARNGKTWAHVQ